MRDQWGDEVASLEITPRRNLAGNPSDALVCVDPAIAAEYGETELQLKEAETYEYLLQGADGKRLRSSLSTRLKRLRDDEEDAGLIETGNFCGTLVFELLEADKVCATALIDVRSLKVDYRTEYRGMLRDLTDRIVGLIVDAQSSAKVSFHSNFEERRDAGWLQLQLELLRETLDGSDFSAALSRILAHPHERLTPQDEIVLTDRPIRHNAATVRKLIHGSPRRGLPVEHPLRVRHGVESVAGRISVSRRYRDLDTPENRFVKYSLENMRTFLDHAAEVFGSTKGCRASTELASRLSEKLESWLGRSFFQAIGPMRLVPIGSPVLQRKAGYREVLRTWLRFRTAAELSWKGGEDVFKAGQRDVATLYEYWLFFVLLEWFCDRFNGGEMPQIEDLVSGLDKDAPQLKLRRKVPLGPFIGIINGSGRRLHAGFHYNRFFSVTHARGESGSWTRRLHPDYTLSFWPVIEGMDSQESLALAEKQELLVHIHLDAKYRIESFAALFGDEHSDDSDEDDPKNQGNYKRQDLLKMHAYRDAIKRSEGAYVLYPGDDACRAAQLRTERGADNPWPHTMRGFHEILPGLGAFAIAPDESGSPKGMEYLAMFMDELMENLCNRASMRERRSADLHKVLRERRALYNLQDVEPDVGNPDIGAKTMAHAKELDQDLLRIPPAQEINVIVCWFKGADERDWMLKHNQVVVRLGKRRGALPMIQAMSSASHILLHGPAYEAVSGLRKIDSSASVVLNRAELQALGYPTGSMDDLNHIYAAFAARPDPAFSYDWIGREIETALKRSRSRQRPSDQEAKDYRRERTKPGIVSLADLEIAMKP